MKSIFDIGNFNLIQDEENYYFFRALNMADNRDIEEGITLDEEGKIFRVRTDRERYLENPENRQPKYKEEDLNSLEQVFDHIKTHYLKETNCISLTCSANIAIDYGRKRYKDKYIIVVVPKNEYGNKVILAGEYILQEIEKRENDYISILKHNNEYNSKLLQYIERIEKSQSIEEIKELVKTRYKGKIDISKSSLKQGIQYSNPVSIFSEYKTLSKEQNLAKNKIVGKLTLLERKGKYKKIIQHERNTKLIDTIGRAFNSLELLHYGEIKKEEIQEVSSKEIDKYSIIQQKKKGN